MENVIWCNDTTGVSNNSHFYYGAYNRLYTAETASPTLKCEQTLYINNIGILTADEIAFAGAIRNVIGCNESFYLYANAIGSYWTMSPSRQYNGGKASYIFIASCRLDYSNQINNTYYPVRPVIALKSDIKVISGTGTQTDPYIVE